MIYEKGVLPLLQPHLATDKLGICLCHTSTYVGFAHSNKCHRKKQHTDDRQNLVKCCFLLLCSFFVSFLGEGNHHSDSGLEGSHSISEKLNSNGNHVLCVNVVAWRWWSALEANRSLYKPHTTGEKNRTALEKIQSPEASPLLGLEVDVDNVAVWNGHSS